MKAIISSLLLLISMVSSGATVFIKGMSWPLEYKNNFYYLPQTYVMPPGTTYLYITIDGIDKVCSLNIETAGLFELVSHLNILINGIKTEWNCFAYTTTIIEVRP